MNGLQARRASFAIEQRQQLRAAVAAADADEPGDRRIAPAPTESRPRARRPSRRRSRCRANTESSYTGSNPSRADLGDAAVELVAGERAGGSDDREAVAGLAARAA